MRFLFAFLLLLTAALTLSARNLEVFFVDVEGGKATLIISPSGESLLIDVGYDGFNNRDANRIAEAARLARVTKIDNLVITHYHGDHVGGVRQLAAKLPITNFFDHGPTVDDGERGEQLYRTYEQIASRGRRIRVEPGYTIPLKGMDVLVVAAGGRVLAAVSPVAGPRSPECANLRRDYSGSENAQSIGLLVVGSEVARLRAGHRPPLKLYVRFSRIQLSRRHNLRDTIQALPSGAGTAPAG